ncbi:MAG TPA: FAD-dependent oxidoreductase [Pseudonocardiaceae bacterium]|nr:FAD-dependent oxidoreductase [Pseudonocardiaceae bacterium]
MSEPIRVAVVGSGPAGLYTAEELVKQGDVAVDVFDRLPAPYGLLRYGVAPDHLKMKTLETALRRILDQPEVRFLGGVEVGVDVEPTELLDYYDAVVYAFGSGSDRRLGIPGEDLAGSFGAKDFVSWYCGHPDRLAQFVLDARSAVVVGAGNVALDVARILAKTSDELRAATDMSDDVLDALATSSISDIHLVARRGPAQAKFTTKELRELGELANADVVVDPDQLELTEADQAVLAKDRVAKRNVDVLRSWIGRPLTDKPRRVHFHFRRVPTAVLGQDRVEAVALRRNEPGADPADLEVLPTELLLRAVGYLGIGLPGVPFDASACVIPNDKGRVLRDGTPSAGEFAVGWIKRGPTGVIGTNKSDAHETVATMLADRSALPRAPHRDPDAILGLLRERNVAVISWAGWIAIEAAELALGAAGGRNRVKIADWAQLLAAAKSAD